MHDAWRVKDDRNGDSKHDELHEPGDLAGEEEEDRYDPGSGTAGFQDNAGETRWSRRLEPGGVLALMDDQLITI